jgi:hypothetical protein
MADFARLPAKPEHQARHWEVVLHDGTIVKVGLAKLISADHGWLKFATGEGALVMFSTVALRSASQT